MRYRRWLQTVHFDEPALEAALLDYVTEVEHVAERIQRLERAIDLAVERAPESMRAVIAALQVLRGVAKLTATTIVAEVGQLPRFKNPKQLVGYTGLVPDRRDSDWFVKAPKARSARSLAAIRGGGPDGSADGAGRNAPWDRD